MLKLQDDFVGFFRLFVLCFVNDKPAGGNAAQWAEASPLRLIPMEYADAGMIVSKLAQRLTDEALRTEIMEVLDGTSKALQSTDYEEGFNKMSLPALRTP